MSLYLSAINYAIFPPVNATLNALSAVLLVTGVVLIKKGHRVAHQRVMVSALVTSAVFLACYLIYHYGVGHTEFPREYPLARKIYLGILVPHIILAVVNVPLILMLVVAAFRGRFEKHKKLARVTFPSWLFVSITGVVIYFMIYVWFLPSGDAAVDKSEDGPASTGFAAVGEASGEGAMLSTGNGQANSVTVLAELVRAGDLAFEPASQAVEAAAGQTIVEVFFSVRNEGAEAVEITRLVSGCECLSVEIDQNPVPANGQAVITGVFDIEKLKGRSERNITVATSQQSRPIFLTTRIDAEPIYTIEESMTSWVIGEEPVTKVVEFRVVRDEPVRVIQAVSHRDEVSCEVVVVEEGRAYDLKLTPASTKSGLLGIVRIETDCEIEAHARPLAYFSIQ